NSDQGQRDALERGESGHGSPARIVAQAAAQAVEQTAASEVGAGGSAGLPQTNHCRAPTPGYFVSGPRATGRSVTLEHPVDQAVLERLLGGEEAVALHVFAHLLFREASVFSVDLIQAPSHVEDLARVDLDVGRLAFKARRRLVDQDARVRQGRTLALRAAGQEQGAH